MQDIDVIAPNFKKRLSGVTSTIVRLVPEQSKEINIRAVGPVLPRQVPRMRFFELFVLSRNKVRIWHARRNSEMLFGLILKVLFRRRLILMFTSASQRHHTKYTRWLISKMTSVVATSQKTAGYLERSAHVIMHGIEVNSFTPLLDKDNLRIELGVPNGFLIGCYGRIRPSKGTDLFITAMINVLPQYPQAKALIMGRATKAHQAFLQEQKKRVAASGLEDRILFLPEVPVDKMADWYRILNLFVAPQRWEGFGLTPLEAMSCGLPVVATKVGAFEEMVTVKNGQLVEPGDAKLLSDAIKPYIKDEKKCSQQGINSRKIAVQDFSLEREAQALNELYKDLLKTST